MIKKSLALILSFLLLFTACTPQSISHTTSTTVDESSNTQSSQISVSDEVLNSVETPYLSENISLANLNSSDLHDYIEDAVYSQLIEGINSDEYFIEHIEAIYISKEYLEELEFNSQENVIFGYKLSDIESAFQGTKYVFSLDENNETVVKEFEPYDDTIEKVINNVLIGTGVILLCVTVASTTVATLPAVSVIFAVSAKAGSVAALSSGLLGGVSTGIITGFQTGDFDEALKSGLLLGSESFKWGAITGALASGVGQAVSLKGATLNGLTMNQAAIIQRESKFPLSIIKQFNSMDEYYALKNAGLTTKIVNGKTALVQKIDIDYIDELGNTNLQRMLNGNAPLSPDGNYYELHHIGQNNDATLAVLTNSQHKQIPNLVEESSIIRTDFQTVRKNFWKDFANQLL